MKDTVGLVFLAIMLPLLFSCSNDDYEANFSLLSGNDFILEVNRISDLPNVQFPSDQLEENDYEEINHDSEYEIGFNEDMQTISIMHDSISGTMMEGTKEYRKYDLDKGRFVIWITDSKFEAEYTVYGSGVPIVRSERGYLLPSK